MDEYGNQTQNISPEESSSLTRDQRKQEKAWKKQERLERRHQKRALTAEKRRLRRAKFKSWLKTHKLLAALIIIIILAALAAAIIALVLLLARPADSAPENPVQNVPQTSEIKYYSALTGLEIPDDSLNSAPTYCVQIPNGTDGARPQVGLAQAAVVFEAIAEAGITRFAAVYQNPSVGVIGPIRSLRSYYLDWDTPFDCTVVHAGGSADALSALQSGGYRDLTESTVYMWRDYNNYLAPNNLFTSSTLLTQFNSENAWTSSSFTAFPRMKPATAAAKAKKALAAASAAEACDCVESLETGEEICDCAATENSDSATGSADAETSADSANPNSAPSPLTESIQVNFGSTPAYNVLYTYDRATNTYPRADGLGQAYLSYTCPADLDGPATVISQQCTPEPVAPSAIAVMLVEESLASDRYHQVITTSGSGPAYIFQNGTATEALWQKSSPSAQIEFRDARGAIISFAPGQLFIEAVPSYGGVVY